MLKATAMLNEENYLYQLILESRFHRNDDEVREACQRIATLSRTIPNLMQKKQFGNLPLHNAAAWSALPIVELIYSIYPDAVRERNKNGNLPLHIACCNNRGNEDVVMFLIEKYPEGRIAVSRNARQVPLHKLGLLGHRYSSELLDSMIDGCEKYVLLHRDVQCETPLMTFARQEKRDASLCDALRRKIMSYALAVFETGKREESVLIFKSVCSDLKTMDLFFSQWPDFAVKDLENGKRPLHIICEILLLSNQFQVIRYFVDIDPRVLTVVDDSLGWTPIHYYVSSRHCNLDILDYFMKKRGSFLETPDLKGNLIFQVAAMRGASVDIIYYLLRETPSVTGRFTAI